MMASLRRVALVVVAVLSISLVPASGAVAFHCSGRQAPPADYREDGPRTEFSGWTVHHDLERRWIGMYYTDGYVYVDASDPENVTYRSFTPFWPHFADVHVRVNPDEEPCVEVGHGQP